MIHSTRTAFSIATAIGFSLFAGHQATRAATNYGIDGTHSSVVFRVKHMGVTYFYGRFNEISGSFTLDEDDPANARFDVTIKTESVDTGNENRDRHLKSPDFFNVKQYPEITFKSTKVEKDGDALKVTGELTLRDVTQSVIVNVENTGTGTHARSGKPIAGMEAIFTIKRSDFGMDYGINNGALGDEVRIMVSLEGAGE